MPNLCSGCGTCYWCGWSAEQGRTIDTADCCAVMIAARKHKLEEEGEH
jgi:hypothetical protein